jgi:hypothetical protein
MLVVKKKQLGLASELELDEKCFMNTYHPSTMVHYWWVLVHSGCNLYAGIISGYTLPLMDDGLFFAQNLQIIERNGSGRPNLNLPNFNAI